MGRSVRATKLTGARDRLRRPTLSLRISGQHQRFWGRQHVPVRRDLVNGAAEFAQVAVESRRGDGNVRFRDNVAGPPDYLSPLTSNPSCRRPFRRPFHREENYRANYTYHFSASSRRSAGEDLRPCTPF